MKTWPPDAWKIGGAGVWGWISYDPQLNLVYYGTANPGPWDAEARPGDNKFASGIFARDPDTGEAVWFYQFSPHDLYDYDAVNENILLDLPINGQTRKVLVHPDRNGYVYVMDRTNGEVLSASPFAPITTSRGVDLKTGLLKYVEEKRPMTGKSSATCARRRPALKIGSLPLFLPAPGYSTFRITISAWMKRTSPPTTLQVRHTLEPMCECMTLPADTEEHSPPSIQPRAKLCGRIQTIFLYGAAHSRPRAISSSTALLTDGSRPSMPTTDRCCGNSRPARELSDNPRPTRDLTASSTWQSFPVLADGPEPS